MDFDLKRFPIQVFVNEIKKKSRRSKRKQVETLIVAENYLKKVVLTLGQRTSIYELMLQMDDLVEFLHVSLNMMNHLYEYSDMHMINIPSNFKNSLTTLVMYLIRSANTDSEVLFRFTSGFLHSFLEVAIENPTSWFYITIISDSLRCILLSYDDYLSETEKTDLRSLLSNFICTLPSPVLMCGDYCCQYLLTQILHCFLTSRPELYEENYQILRKIFPRFIHPNCSMLMTDDRFCWFSFLNVLNSTSNRERVILSFPVLHLLIGESVIKSPFELMGRSFCVNFSYISKRMHFFATTADNQADDINISFDQIESVCIYMSDINIPELKGAHILHIHLSVDIIAITESLVDVDKDCRSLYIIAQDLNSMNEVAKQMKYPVHKYQENFCQYPHALLTLYLNRNQQSINPDTNEMADENGNFEVSCIESDQRSIESFSENFGYEEVMELRKQEKNLSDQEDNINPGQKECTHFDKENARIDNEESIHSDPEETVYFGQEENIRIDQEECIHSDQEETVHSDQEETVHSDQDETVHSDQEQTVHSDQEETVHSDQDETVHSDQEETVHSDQEETVHSDQEETVHSDQENVHSDQENVYSNQENVHSHQENSHFDQEENIRIELEESIHSEREEDIGIEHEGSIHSDQEGSIHSDQEGSIHSDQEGSIHSDQEGSIHSDQEGSTQIELEENIHSDQEESIHSDQEENIPFDQEENIHSDLEENILTESRVCIESNSEKYIKTHHAENIESEEEVCTETGKKFNYKSTPENARNEVELLRTSYDIAFRFDQEKFVDTFNENLNVQEHSMKSLHEINYESNHESHCLTIKEHVYEEVRMSTQEVAYGSIHEKVVDNLTEEETEKTVQGTSWERFQGSILGTLESLHEHPFPRSLRNSSINLHPPLATSSPIKVVTLPQRSSNVTKRIPCYKRSLPNEPESHENSDPYLPDFVSNITIKRYRKRKQTLNRTTQSKSKEKPKRAVSKKRLNSKEPKNIETNTISSDIENRNRVDKHNDKTSCSSRKNVNHKRKRVLGTHEETPQGPESYKEVCPIRERDLNVYQEQPLPDFSRKIKTHNRRLSSVRPCSTNFFGRPNNNDLMETEPFSREFNSRNQNDVNDNFHFDSSPAHVSKLPTINLLSSPMRRQFEKMCEDARGELREIFLNASSDDEGKRLLSTDLNLKFDDHFGSAPKCVKLTLLGQKTKKSNNQPKHQTSFATRKK